MPSRYGSIAWNKQESRYSQAKIELYGVYRCLRALRIYLIGLPTFNIEVDAKYIKGMINNPDIQPNNAMNRWIAAILLFTFELVHVPGKLHGGPDRLSRRKGVEGDVEEREDGRVDRVLGLGLWEETWMGHTRDNLTTNTVSTAYLQMVSATPSSMFLSFSLKSTTLTPDVDIPRTDDDKHMNNQLLVILEFLSTMKAPENLDDKARKQFV